MKKIYFTGIKGVGMAPLAILLKQRGHEVAGSDVASRFITDDMLENEEIALYTDFKKENLQKFFKHANQEDSILIYTAAHNGRSNTEVQEAIQRDYTTLSLGKALGLLSRGELFNVEKKTIAVAGTHGKTTTAAMLACAMKKIQDDPSYIVGTGEIFPLGAPGHYGNGDHLVLEADEYVSETTFEKRPKFLELSPVYAIVTNIDFDHPDVFKDIEEVKKAFGDFLQNIPEDKFIIVNSDDKNLMEVIGKSGKKYISYGSGNEADYKYQIKQHTKEGIDFVVNTQSQTQKIHIKLSGAHNVSNATAVFALLSALKYRGDKIAQALKSFSGSKRRGEQKGKTENGAIVIDDYAHHPQEVEVTIDGIKEKYQKKIICIFQPHTYSRTKALLKDFAKSFVKVDELILLPIFASAREKDTKSITEEEYLGAFKKENKKVKILHDQSAVIKYLRGQGYDKNHLILTMGAGDVYKISDSLMQKNNATKST